MKSKPQPKALKGEVLPPVNKAELAKLETRANALDQKLRKRWSEGVTAFLDSAKMLKQMHDEQLHRYVFKPNSRKHFEAFDEYVDDVTHGMARGKVFELLGIGKLLEGPHALPEEEVAKMPQKSAYELSRLEPQHRTPEIIKAAQEEPVEKVKQRVQEKINMHLPPEDRKEILVLFAINLPPEVRDAIEELLEEMIWMEGIRDGDKSVSLRAKAFMALVANFRANFAVELAEAVHYRETHENAEQTIARRKAQANATPPEPREEETVTVH
jgi:hypothetical protein